MHGFPKNECVSTRSIRTENEHLLVAVFHRMNNCNTWGTPQKTQNLFIKKLCIYSSMFTLQSPSKYSPFDAIYLLRHFFHCSKQFLNSSI